MKKCSAILFFFSLIVTSSHSFGSDKPAVLRVHGLGNGLLGAILPLDSTIPYDPEQLPINSEDGILVNKKSLWGLPIQFMESDPTQVDKTSLLYQSFRDFLLGNLEPITYFITYETNKNRVHGNIQISSQHKLIIFNTVVQQSIFSSLEEVKSKSKYYRFLSHFFPGIDARFVHLEQEFSQFQSEIDTFAKRFKKPDRVIKSFDFYLKTLRDVHVLMEIAHQIPLISQAVSVGGSGEKAIQQAISILIKEIAKKIETISSQTTNPQQNTWFIGLNSSNNLSSTELEGFRKKMNAFTKKLIFFGNDDKKIFAAALEHQLDILRVESEGYGRPSAYRILNPFEYTWIFGILGRMVGYNPYRTKIKPIVQINDLLNLGVDCRGVLK